MGSLWRRIYSEIGGRATQRRLQPQPERIRYRGHLKMADSDCAGGIREEARQTLATVLRQAEQRLPHFSGRRSLARGCRHAEVSFLTSHSHGEPRPRCPGD